MIRLAKEQLNIAATLFNGIEDTMVTACMQGYMGEAYVIALERPKAGLIVSGEYCFWGGNPKSDEACQLVNHLFDVVPGGITIGIFADDEPGWEDTLMACSKNHPTAVPRYRIAMKDYVFDQNLLQDFADSLPEGFELAPFNEDIYRQAMAEEWSKEFCEVFSSMEDFLSRGFGYAVLKDGKLVSGASSMTVYDGGIEIQVATRDEYRQKGLAIACAAALVKECTKRNVRPAWDAANLVSKKMALKLGFEYAGEYTTIHMHR